MPGLHLPPKIPAPVGGPLLRLPPVLQAWRADGSHLLLGGPPGGGVLHHLSSVCPDLLNSPLSPRLPHWNEPAVSCQDLKWVSNSYYIPNSHKHPILYKSTHTAFTSSRTEVRPPTPPGARVRTVPSLGPQMLTPICSVCHHSRLCPHQLLLAQS